MAKSKQMFSAREMRKKGESIKEIAKKLSVSVSSASTWCRAVVLTEEQKENLKKRITNPYYGKKLLYLEQKRKEFDAKVNQLKKDAKQEVGKVTKREIFLIGVALYWGEGFKKDHSVGLATSDPAAARFFIHWLITCFNIKKENLIIRATINILHQKREEIIQQQWSKILSIPKNQFSKPYFQKTKWKKEYENKETYFGVVRIKVRKSIGLLRKIYGYIEAVSEIT